MGKFELTIGTDIMELQRIHTFLGEIATKWGLGEDMLFRLELVIEEAVSNIIHYGYDEPQAGQMIHLELIDKDNTVTIIISDNGKEFNPLKVPPPDDLGKEAKDRKIGGMGIHFIRNMMDKVEYSRVGDRNILTLIKVISKE